MAMESLLSLSDAQRAAFQFLTSLAVGLLIGLERERHPEAKAGLRTCALVALFGTICGLIGQLVHTPWFVAIGLVLVGAFVIVAHRPEHRGNEVESGTTTIISVLLCYCYGVMIWFGHSQLAVALAIATTVLLHFKTELHGFSSRLSPQDIASVLQFAVLTFVVLPLLPDQGYGPYRVLNPHHVWVMVVLISGLGLAGYMALRIVGTRKGALLAGLCGGLVSSTATTVVYARQAAERPELAPLSAAVIVLANLVVLFRLGTVCAVVAPAVLPSLLPVLATGLIVALLVLVPRLSQPASELPPALPVLTNPTNVRVALGFALLYAAVLVGAAWLSDIAGKSGLYAMAFASGFVDVDAITLSSLQLHNSAAISAVAAVTVITIAFVSNLGFKLMVVTAIGRGPLTRSCLLGLLAPAIGMLGALALL